jgi:hypothetical protein
MRPGRDADPSPPSIAKVEKQSRAIALLSLRAFVACKKCETYLDLDVLGCFNMYVGSLDLDVLVCVNMYFRNFDLDYVCLVN